MKKFAEFISLIFNPLFMILLIILLGIEKSVLSQTETIVLLLIVLLFNGFLPACSLLYFSNKGIVIDDIVYNKKVIKNRAFLLAWGTIISFLECVMLYLLKKPEPIFAILIALLIMMAILFSVNIYRKISLHASGITFFCLTTIMLFGWKLWPILILIPLVSWSRLYLVRHTAKQLLAGVLLSTVIVWGIFYFSNLIP